MEGIAAAGRREARGRGEAPGCTAAAFERIGADGEVKPPTLTGGGFMPRSTTNAGKAGHGFNLVAATTSTGFPLAYRVTPLAVRGHSEGETALAMFQDEWQRQIAPHLDSRKLGICTADGAYSKSELRQQLRGMGYVDNCHPVSHADRDSSRDNARRHDQMEFQIHGYPNWRSNGHRELYCLCGGYTLTRRLSRDPSGRAIVRTEGSCTTCGSIMITSGKWRLTQNPSRFVRVLPGEEQRIDWRFGNPLTFHDPLSNQFGKARFGHGEGFHGHLVTRFGLLKGKSWHRRREQAELDCLIIFSFMHALAMEQRQRAKRPAPAASAPPGSVAPPGPPGLAAVA